jgi:ribonuclease HepT-like protein
MPSERDERVYLGDILSAIERAIEYTTTGREAFFADSKTQDAVIRNVEIMGEAVKGISSATRLAHPEIPWSKIARDPRSGHSRVLPSGSRYRVGHRREGTAEAARALRDAALEMKCLP